MKSSTWSEFLWGPVTATLATVVLAVASVVGGADRPWLWIIGSAAFLIIHTMVSSALEQSVVRRLGRDYDRVQHRAVQIVADLGQLTADQFDLWMVDLYLPRWRYSWQGRFPFIGRSRSLERQLSVSLIDARPQPPSVDPFAGPHGSAFAGGQPVLWFDGSMLAANPDNAWTSYATQENKRLAGVYGVLNVVPLVDQLGKNCVGVLAVHVAPEPDRALRALGALTTPEARRRLTNACVEMNGLIAKRRTD
ncbi:MAG TPA: hypothetical protein PKD80_05175 [Microthrixaceae bacterium]|nr:hypothetical protein [Microthrixaceae bacterium]HMT24439.1 hypothetical protein [Microthrixaceae bacterium]HMT60870.1 hypothetical protein [Microthrixaceae bacterium]